MTKSLQHQQVVLKLPDSTPALILRGRHIVMVMTQSSWFANLLSLLNAVSLDLDTLQTAQATSSTRARGAASARDDAKKKVIDDLTGLAGEVQRVVDQNVGEGPTITEAAGMYQKKKSARSKPDLAAVKGDAPGLVLVRARAVKRAAYEWECSTDGGATWVSLGLTTVAHTSVAGVARGTTCLFRFRTTRGSATGAWSQTVGFYMY